MRAQFVVGDESALTMTTAIQKLIATEREELNLVTASLTAESTAETEVSQHRSNELALVLLSHQTTAGVAITGAVALRVTSEEAFVYPGSLAARLSRLLANLGDAATRGM